MPFLLRFRRKPSGGGTTRLYLLSRNRLGNASESPNDHPADFLQAAARVKDKTIPSIAPDAPAAEQDLYNRTRDLALSTRDEQLLARPMLTLQAGGIDSGLEDFAFAGHPASVNLQGPRMVINVGSDDDGSAARLGIVNGRIQEMKGASLQDPETRLHALQSAVLALMSGVARKNGMPHALEAMQRLQAYNPR